MAVARGACLLLLAAAATALPTTSAAAAEVVYQAETTATAVHISVTQQPAGSLITASLFDDAVAYAAGTIDSGGSSEALAAPAFPGRLVVQGPALLCSQVFPCPTDPPAYPLLADASYPRRKHDRADAAGRPMGGGPFVVSPLGATATATADGNVGRTRGGAVSLLAGTPAAFTAAASRAVSRVHALARGLRVHVEAHVSGIRIGDLVTIGAVHAIDDVVVRPGRRPVDRPSIAVSDVRVGGQPATVDDDGIHVAGTDGPSLTRTLEQQGIRIRTVGVHRADTHDVGRSDATGLSIDADIPVDGVPYVPNPLPPLPPPFDQVPALPGVNVNGSYVAHLTLGAVGAAAGTGLQPTFDLGGVTGTEPASTADHRGGSTAGSEEVAPTGRGLVDGLAAPAPVDAPAVAPPQFLLGRFEDVLSAAQLETLYAVLALGSVGLFVGWRATVLLRRRSGLPFGGRTTGRRAG